MVAFLEKHFEFTSPLSIEECAVRLQAQSKRGSGWLASRRDILVHVSDDENGKKFDLNRDVGKNLYAEVLGQLQKDGNGSVHVKGFGRIPLIFFLGLCWFFVWACIIAYAMRAIPLLSACVFLSSIFLLIFWAMIIKNRNNLIKLVYQTLDANGEP